MWLMSTIRKLAPASEPMFSEKICCKIQDRFSDYPMINQAVQRSLVLNFQDTGFDFDVQKLGLKVPKNR